jgi:hypothetical protein
MKGRFAYSVIISDPRFAPRQGANADAVAAALVNMVHGQLGGRQGVLLGLDARDKAQREYAGRLLAEHGIEEQGLKSTPLLYSARDGVFTKPGMVSLQLLLDLASQIQPRGPTASVTSVLLEFPHRHDLEFEADWANALEVAERPETRMLASPDMRSRMPKRTFSTHETKRVSADDIADDGEVAPTAAAAAAAAAGAGAAAQPATIPRGAPLAAVRMAEGMDSYADLSVANGMSQANNRRFSISHIPTGDPNELPRLRQVETSGGSGSGSGEDLGLMIDIESRMFERLPQILQVGEERTLTERELIKRTAGGTDEEATKREIQRVKRQRAEMRRSGTR